jgi:hypothetical protein
VIDLFLATVTAVTVEGRGTLTLDFADGAQLTVPPSDIYESWELSGDGAPGILVGPGGETNWTASRLKPRLRASESAWREIAWRESP